MHSHKMKKSEIDLYSKSPSVRTLNGTARIGPDSWKIASVSNGFKIKVSTGVYCEGHNMSCLFGR